MTKELNAQWLLAATPKGGLPVAEDFLWVTEDLPKPAQNQMLTETVYLSLDPYQWGRRRSGVELPGEVCHGRTVSRVVKSRISGFAEGDYVFNTNGWQQYGLSGEGIGIFGYMHPRKLDPIAAPISTAIGVLGMLGLTAYSGLMVQCQPKAGETVVVSAASGGVGQVAVQLARLAGCRVVGIAGAQHKVEYLEALGVDSVVSHLDPQFPDKLQAACPDGCDIYFENVGGKVFDAVLPLLNKKARITLCGVVSQYGNTDGQDPRAVWQAIGQPFFERQQVTVYDLFVGNFVDQFQEVFLREMAGYLRSGEVKYKEDLRQGLASAPQAFYDMLTGDNFGKTLVATGDDPTR